MHFPAQNPAKTAIDFFKIHVAEKAAFWQTLDWGARPKNGEPMMVSGGKIPHRSGVGMLFPPSLQRGEPRFARNKGGVRMLSPPRAFAFAKIAFYVFASRSLWAGRNGWTLHQRRPRDARCTSQCLLFGNRARFWEIYAYLSQRRKSRIPPENRSLHGRRLRATEAK